MRLLGSLLLIFGCLIIFEFIIDPTNFFIMLFFLIYILVCFIVGAMFVFWIPKNTISFDKNQGKMILKRERLVGAEILEYPLGEITDVIVEQAESLSISSSILVLKIASNSKLLRFHSTTFMGSKKIEEIANLIRTFINS